MAVAFANRRDGAGQLSMASRDASSSSTKRQRPRGSAQPTFCECGDHAFANLTRGHVVVVSPEDARQLDYHWHVNTSGERYLTVVRSKSIGSAKHKTVVLAREIMAAAAGQLVDHKNLNPLDNTRENLRFASIHQNKWNCPVRRDSSTGVKGVRRAKSGRFEARIKILGRYSHLGTFDTVEEAHQAYHNAATIHHRDFARSL